MEKEFENSATFGQFYKYCMSGKRAYKGNSWNLSKTIKVANEIITLYTNQSKIQNFPNFFTEYLKTKFKKKSARINYALIIFFSLLSNSSKSFEIQIYRRLFNSRVARKIFQYWIKVRKNVCIAKDIKFTTNFMLETLFLHRSEADVIAKKSGYPKLNEFKEWIDETETRVRESRKLRDKQAQLERRGYDPGASLILKKQAMTKV